MTVCNIKQCTTFKIEPSYAKRNNGAEDLLGPRSMEEGEGLRGTKFRKPYSASDNPDAGPCIVQLRFTINSQLRRLRPQSIRLSSDSQNESQDSIESLHVSKGS